MGQRGRRIRAQRGTLPSMHSLLRHRGKRTETCTASVTSRTQPQRKEDAELAPRQVVIVHYSQRGNIRMNTARLSRLAVIGCLALTGSATALCAEQALSLASANASTPLPPPPPPPPPAPPVEEPSHPGEKTPPKTEEVVPKTEETKTTPTPTPSSAVTPVSSPTGASPVPAPGVPAAAKVNKAKSSRSCKRVKHHRRCKHHSKRLKHHAGTAHAASIVVFQPGNLGCMSERVSAGQPSITVNDPNSGYVDWTIPRLDVWTGSGWQVAGWGHYYYQYRDENTSSYGFINYNTGEGGSEVFGAAAGRYYRVIDYVFDGELRKEWYTRAEPLFNWGSISNTYYCYMEPSGLNW
jgi:outer membrane biosynthesis protein TonB